MTRARMVAAMFLLVGGCSRAHPLRGGTAEERSARLATTNLFGVAVPWGHLVSGTAIRSLGAKWIRLELVDSSPGAALSADAQRTLDATIADYHANGLQILLLLSGSSAPGFPGFTTDGPRAPWDPFRAAFLARTSWLAETYGSQIDAWEFWNEPDEIIRDGSDPAIPASDYGPFLKAGYDAIHAFTSAPVLMGGLDQAQISYVRDALSAAGLASYSDFADAVAIHPYGVPPDDTWCTNDDPGEGLHCEWGRLESKTSMYFDEMSIPVWITEMGIHTADTVHQASYIRSAYEVLAGDPNVPTAIYFAYTDVMETPFGLTNTDLSPKPNAYAQYQASAMAGGAMAPMFVSRLHGTVSRAGTPLVGVTVSAWGHDAQDLHTGMTDALGIYAFDGLDAQSEYNLLVNQIFVDGNYETIDPRFDVALRNNVELVGGPDGWHGEDFSMPAPMRTARLHGTVQAGGTPIEGLSVTAWGQTAGDLHSARTDALGVFALSDLDPLSPYNIIVNGVWTPSGIMPVDPSHATAERDNVVLEPGPDGWHGENFGLGF